MAAGTHVTRRLARRLALLVALAALVGCGRDKAPSPAPAPGHKPPAAQPSPASEAAKPKVEPRAKLAAAYHVIRCGLTNAAVLSTDLYKDLGYADAAAFGAEFEAEASQHPDWARGVVAGSLARACAGTEPTR